MGVTRTDLFTARQNELADMARVLGHPARIAILDYLLRSSTCCNSHLVEELGLAQATVSQHLRALKESGLIQGSIDGVSVNYCIDHAAWGRLRLFFEAFFDQLAPGTACAIDGLPSDCTCATDELSSVCK